MTRPLYIFDLDGTLADAEHRIHHIRGENKDWRAFFAACVDDKPIMFVDHILESLQGDGAECWIWTGRSDEVREQTLKWLERHDMYWACHTPSVHEFRMRPAGDHTPDHELKQAWLHALDPVDRQRLVATFEDRSRVVQMWRDNGVPCFQVSAGDF